MKLFLLFVGLVAICDSRSILNELPGVGIKGSIDDQKITIYEVSLAEEGVRVSGRARDDGEYEFVGGFKDLILRGDTKGEYHASLNADELKLNADFDKVSGFKGWQGELDLGLVGLNASGDKVGIGKYELAADVGSARGRMSGDLRDRKVPVEYEGHIGLGLVGEGNLILGRNTAYGAIEADIKTNTQNYRDYAGTVWMGPFGLQVKYDNAHAFIYQVLVSLGIVSGSALYNSQTAAQQYAGELNVGPLHARIETGNDKKTYAAVSLAAFGAAAQIQKTKEGIYSADVGFTKSGYGLYASAFADKDHDGYYQGNATVFSPDLALQAQHTKGGEMKAGVALRIGPYGFSVSGTTNKHFNFSLILNDKSHSLKLWNL